MLTLAGWSFYTHIGVTCSQFKIRIVLFQTLTYISGRSEKHEQLRFSHEYVHLISLNRINASVRDCINFLFKFLNIRFVATRVSFIIQYSSGRPLNNSMSEIVQKIWSACGIYGTINKEWKGMWKKKKHISLINVYSGGNVCGGSLFSPMGLQT